MAEDVQGMLALLTRYGYLIVFIAAMAEALPLLGWLVPGQAIILLAGALAAGGYFSLTTLILIAIPAGIIGDAVGYYIGWRYGRSFLDKYGARVRISPQHVARSEALFEKYGAFALVLARFSFLTRAVGPIFAGMAKMRPALFWTVNVIGAIAWSVTYSVIGYASGLGFSRLQDRLGVILAWTLLGVVGLYIFYRLLKRYASQFTRDDLYIALFGVAGGTIFGVIADRVQRLGAENGLDSQQAAIAAALAPAAPFFRVVDVLTSFPVLGAVALIAFAYFFWKRAWWDATLVGFGLGGMIVLVETLRPIFRALLPPGPGDSFPSASAASPLVLAGVVTYLVWTRTKRRRGPLLAAAGGALVAGTSALARLAQGTEYPSSVLAGLALGVAWLSVTVLVVEFRLKRDPKPAVDAPRV